MNKQFFFVSLILFLTVFIFSSAQITRIWLTHRSNSPSKLVINWQSTKVGNSVVYFQIEGNEKQKLVVEDQSNIHHVEIPLKERGVNYHYQVVTGDEMSEVYTFKGYPLDEEELRIAVVGNWGYAENPDLRHLSESDPHLLLSLGDNIDCLHRMCGEGLKDCIEPYLELIDSAPDLFRSVPFMPILGNHDKEIRNRGVKYPKDSVYDIEATAFRYFFELPDDEWKWIFTIPEFDCSFVALDLNHTSDVGTTWQTCHDFDEKSSQFEWYKDITDNNKQKFLITLQNEKNSTVRSLNQGKWKKLVEKGCAVISGYGYFQERAEVNAFPYYTTSLNTGDKYPDEFMEKLFGVKGYIYISFYKHKLKIEMRSLEGDVLDTRFIENEKREYPGTK